MSSSSYFICKDILDLIVKSLFLYVYIYQYYIIVTVICLSILRLYLCFPVKLVSVSNNVAYYHLLDWWLQFKLSDDIFSNIIKWYIVRNGLNVFWICWLGPMYYVDLFLKIQLLHFFFFNYYIRIKI